jgi:diguanylate cyclase (GGDEF)-like protein
VSRENAGEKAQCAPAVAGTSLADLADELGGLLEGAGARRPAGGTAAADDQLMAAIAQLKSAARATERKLADQKTRITHLEQISTTDELTGILNRRGFEEEFRRVLARARRQGEEGVLVYVDLDGFKPVNDRFGHAAGDEVLRRVAGILVESVRGSDSVARIGGDEFCVLLVKTSRQDGCERAETLNRALNSATVRWNERRIAVRASFGLQAFSARDNAKELLNSADAAMYRIKRFKEISGRRLPPPVSPSPADLAPAPRLGYAD